MDKSTTSTKKYGWVTLNRPSVTRETFPKLRGFFVLEGVPLFKRIMSGYIHNFV
jgi:hypothetical protein